MPSPAVSSTLRLPAPPAPPPIGRPTFGDPPPDLKASSGGRVGSLTARDCGASRRRSKSPAHSQHSVRGPGRHRLNLKTHFAAVLAGGGGARPRRLAGKALAQVRVRRRRWVPAHTPGPRRRNGSGDRSTVLGGSLRPRGYARELGARWRVEPWLGFKLRLHLLLAE